jgi:glutaredoxin-like YruB-family protein
MLIKSLLALATLLLTVSFAGAEMSQQIDNKAEFTLAKAERFSGTVELYITDWCGYCKKAQKYLKDRDIPFVAYDIEKDSAANQRHKALGGNGVPLVVIGANKISGFNPEAMDYYLNNSK